MLGTRAQASQLLVGRSRRSPRWLADLALDDWCSHLLQGPGEKRGKAWGKPVCELMGMPARDRVRAGASALMPETQDTVVECMRELVESGLTSDAAQRRAYSPGDSPARRLRRRADSARSWVPLNPDAQACCRVQ